MMDQPVIEHEEETDSGLVETPEEKPAPRPRKPRAPRKPKPPQEGGNSAPPEAAE